MSVEFTPTMMVRERTVWLTDNPGAMVEDFDRLPRPFNSVHGDQHCHRHIAYLDGSETMTKRRPRSHERVTWLADKHDRIYRVEPSRMVGRADAHDQRREVLLSER